MQNKNKKDRKSIFAMLIMINPVKPEDQSYIVYGIVSYENGTIQTIPFRITLFSEIDINNLTTMILLPEGFISNDTIIWSENITANIGNHTIKVSLSKESHTLY